jgi:gas vesicle protein
MKRPYTLLFAVLLFPTFAYAAWWNPKTWGDKPVTYVSESPAEQVNQEPIIKEVIVEKIVEVPVDRIVEKTTNVPPPSVLSRLAELEEENVYLKSKIDKITQEYEDSINEINDEFAKKLKNSIRDALDEHVENQDKDISDRIRDIDDKLEDIEEDIQEEIAEAMMLKSNFGKLEARTRVEKEIRAKYKADISLLLKKKESLSLLLP